MLIGGIVFNTILYFNYYNKSAELEHGIPTDFAFKVFGGKFISYILLICVAIPQINNIIPIIFFTLLLMSGGYTWFWVLQGYIHAKNGRLNVESTPWIERALLVSIFLSLILGYLYMRIK